MFLSELCEYKMGASTIPLHISYRMCNQKATRSLTVKRIIEDFQNMLDIFEGDNMLIQEFEGHVCHEGSFGAHDETHSKIVITSADGTYTRAMIYLYAHKVIFLCMSTGKRYERVNGFGIRYSLLTSYLRKVA